jgi:hypothetical protein
MVGRLTDRLEDRDRAVLAGAHEVLSWLIAIARAGPSEPLGGSRVRPRTRRETA